MLLHIFILLLFCLLFLGVVRDRQHRQWFLSQGICDERRDSAQTTHALHDERQR